MGDGDAVPNNSTYCLHTLGSTALLISPRAFPSRTRTTRLQIPPASHRLFPSLARFGRIFAYAHFHHRDQFEPRAACMLPALTEIQSRPSDCLVNPPSLPHLPRPLDEKTAGGGAVRSLRRVWTCPRRHCCAPRCTSSGHLRQPGTASSDRILLLGRREGDSGVAARIQDTMMLEGEERLPPSPESAAVAADDAEGGPTGLDAALAAAGVCKKRRKEGEPHPEPESASKPEFEPESEPSQPTTAHASEESPSLTSAEKAPDYTSMLERDHPDPEVTEMETGIAMVPTTPPAAWRKQHEDEGPKQEAVERSVQEEGGVKEGSVQEAENAHPCDGNVRRGRGGRRDGYTKGR
ncbi:hypothetical protein C8R45DRAFT_927858 [Mycena sanguinolenta]|nr:hypothetical protein C8R45DRAFT_927858 [Mycena sanguinolenta]